MKCRKYRLSDIGRIVSGATPKTADPDNFGGSIAWITPADLSGYRDKYISHGAKSITEKGYNSCSTQLIPAGSVLFSSRAPIGYVAIAKNPICTNQGFKSIIPDECVDSEYLYYQLICLRKHIQDLGSGTTFKEISAKKFAQVEVIVPPLLEQKLIVSRIEELFSQLDSGVETLKKTKQQLMVYRQAVLTEAFDVNVQYVKISDICSVIRGGSPRPAGDEKYYNGSIPFLKVADITNSQGMYLDHATYTIKEAGLSKTRMVPAGTLLLSNSGATLGVPKICTFDTTFNDGIAAFVDFKMAAYLPFYYYFWQSKTIELRAINQGAAQPNLNTAIIGNVSVPYCSFDRQAEITHWIESRLSICDSIEQTLDAALQQAEALRQSILKKAFEGEL